MEQFKRCLSLYRTIPYLWVPSGAGTFVQLSGEVYVLKCKSDNHFTNKPGVLRQINLVYLLSLYELQELNKNLEVLESQMIVGKF